MTPIRIYVRCGDCLKPAVYGSYVGQAGAHCRDHLPSGTVQDVRDLAARLHLDGAKYDYRDARTVPITLTTARNLSHGGRFRDPLYDVNRPFYRLAKAPR